MVSSDAALMRPLMSLPRAMVMLRGRIVERSDSRISRRLITSRLLFGTSMPTVGLPGRRSISTDSACNPRQRSSRQRGDAAVFHARFRLVFEGRDDRTGVDLHDRAANVELFELRFDAACDFFQFLAVVAVAGRNFIQQFGRGQPISAAFSCRWVRRFGERFVNEGDAGIRLRLVSRRLRERAIGLVFESADGNLVLRFDFRGSRIGVAERDRKEVRASAEAPAALCAPSRRLGRAVVQPRRLRRRAARSAARALALSMARWRRASRGCFPAVAPTHAISQWDRATSASASTLQKWKRSKERLLPEATVMMAAPATSKRASRKSDNDHADHAAGLNGPADEPRAWNQAAGGRDAKPERQAAEDAEPGAFNRRGSYPLPTQRPDMYGQQEDADAEDLQTADQPISRQTGRADCGRAWRR